MKLDEKWLREHLPEDIRDEDLNYWQLDRLCHFLGKADKTGTWRWYRDHAENARLPGFERYLMNVRSDKTDAVTQDNVIMLVD